jgi:cell division protein FtsB
MQLKRTALFLSLISLTLPTPTRTIDPITGSLAAAAIGALIGTAGYLAYDYTHYSSDENCRKAIHDFYRMVHEPNVYAQAAGHPTLAPLIPVYKKLVSSNYEYNYSLSLVAITQQVVKQAYHYIDTLNSEFTRLKRYKDYNNYGYTPEVQQCEQRIRDVEAFYKTMNVHTSPVSSVTHEISNELHNNLLHELQKKAFAGRHPLHDYIKRLQSPFGIYKKFIQDNNYANWESSRLINEVDQTIQSIKASQDYYIEKQAMELENLLSTYHSLQNSLAYEQRNNNTLRHENNDLANKNRTLYRVVQDLQNIRYCYECQLHTQAYFNTPTYQTFQDTYHLHAQNQYIVPAYRPRTYSRIEEQQIEIEQLKSAITSLRYSLSHLQQENSNLRNHNDDIKAKNRNLKNIIEELKSIHYCHACQSHTTVYFHNY